MKSTGLSPFCFWITSHLSLDRSCQGQYHNGANGSLGLGLVESLLASYPECTLVATVRNPSAEEDANTAKLKSIITKHPSTHVVVEKLDLASLAEVWAFAENIARKVSHGEIPPISAIVCNSFAWSLRGMKSTSDGYEASFQVSHLSHFLLVLKLLGSMDTTSSRIVMLESGAHFPERENSLSKLRPGLPADLKHLIHPLPDDLSEVHDRGFQRYGTSKLANVMFANDLNERLRADPRLCNITAITMDPGGLVGSRAQVEQRKPVRAMLAVSNALMPVLKHFTHAPANNSRFGARPGCNQPWAGISGEEGLLYRAESRLPCRSVF